MKPEYESLRAASVDDGEMGTENFALAAIAQGANQYANARVLVHQHNLGWEKLPAIVRFLNLAVEQVQSLLPPAHSEEALKIDDTAQQAFRRCGSPIEELFLAHCVLLDRYRFTWNVTGETPAILGIWAHRGVALHQQVYVEKFRLDFAFVTTDGRTRVAIELDGHEWHERSKVQAAKDKSRDRRLQELGWAVLRFTGSEIWKDAGACVDEAIRIALTVAGER